MPRHPLPGRDSQRARPSCDFLHYTVDVVSLTLENFNGRTVETPPAAGRLDFAEYRDLTELVTAARVPLGTR